MTYQELCTLDKDALNRQPCKCVSCSTCRGTGRLWLPNSFEADDSIACDECDGGITEECDRCQLLGQLLHDEEIE